MNTLDMSSFLLSLRFLFLFSRGSAQNNNGGQTVVDGEPQRSDVLLNVFNNEVFDLFLLSKK